MKKILLTLLIIVMATTSVMAKGEVVVSLGQDLNEEQKNQMIDVLGGDENSTIMEVTNAEERKYLGGHVPSNLIGSEAISSASVEILEEGSGIKAQVFNVTWVTEEMVISAVATAGIKDAKVMVAAPSNFRYDVSGTAGLTGIIKAFEDATGEKVSEEQKEVANEEIAKTGELGQEIGKDQAAELVKRVKEDVIAGDLKTKEDIQEAIEEGAQELNITLTEEQKAKISQLMEKISNLDLNVEDIKGQIKNISDKLGKIAGNSDEVTSVLQKIGDFFNNLFARLFGNN